MPVTTRAQARATAAAINANQAVVLPTASPVAAITGEESSAIVAVPRSLQVINDQRIQASATELVESFWDQTQRLAAEASILQSHQQQQAQDYQAALAAVHHDARSNAAELAAHQTWVENQIQQALVETRTALQQELHVAANAQTVSHESERMFVEEKLRVAREEAHQEVLQLEANVSTHITDTEGMERRMSTAISKAYDSLNQHVEALRMDPSPKQEISVELKQMWGDAEQEAFGRFQEMANLAVQDFLAGCEERGAIGKISRHRIQKLVAEAASAQEKTIVEHVKTHLNQARQMLAVDLSADADARGVKLAQQVQQQVHVETTEMEERVVLRVTDLLKAAHANMEKDLHRHVEATNAMGAQLERTQAKLKDEMSGMKARIHKLETQPLRHNTQQPFDLPVLPSVRAPARRVATKPAPALLKPKPTNPPTREKSSKLQRAIAQAQQAVKCRAEIAARYYENGPANHPNLTDQADN
jgi:hypothetical protein